MTVLLLSRGDFLSESAGDLHKETIYGTLHEYQSRAEVDFFRRILPWFKCVKILPVLFEILNETKVNCWITIVKYDISQYWSKTPVVWYDHVL